MVASACSEQSFNLGSYGFWINCCTKDGCNSADGYNSKYLHALIQLASVAGIIRYI